MFIFLIIQVIITFLFLYIYFNYYNEYLLDVPNSISKIHQTPTPYLGGFILSINLIIIFIYFYFVNQPLILDNNLLIKHLDSKIFILVFFLSTLFFISIGLFDDIYQLKYYTRLFLTGSILYLSISLYADLQITKLNFDFFSTINITTIAIPFTVLCFLTLINSLNFYDGINGQSSLYIMFLLSYIFFKSSFPIVIFLIVPLVIFLYLNLKGMAFMGDSGIYGYSYIIGLLFVLAYNSYFLNIEEIILLTLLPFFDLLRLSYARIIRGNSPFIGDLYHIHHLIFHSNSIYYTNFILILLFMNPIILYLFFDLFFINIFIFIILYLLVIRYFKLKIIHNGKSK